MGTGLGSCGPDQAGGLGLKVEGMEGEGAVAKAPSPRSRFLGV